MMKKSGSMSEYSVISLEGRVCEESEKIMTSIIASKLKKHLPPIYRLAYTWKLVYGSAIDGFSLKTLYHKSRNTGPCILAIKTTDDDIFGAFCSDELAIHPNHYGNNTCFLWKQVNEFPLKIVAYHTNSTDSIYLFSDPNFLAIGCGDGKFGLWVDANLEYGVSARVPVFNNDVLASPFDGEFVCLGIEVWTPII